MLESPKSGTSSPTSGILGFYRRAYWAVTEFPFYRTVLEQPLYRTLLYLLYLSSHAAVVLTLSYAWHYASTFQDFSLWLEENVPPLVVEDGELRIEGEQPLVRTYWGEASVTFVFDTTGTHRDLDRFGDPSVLLTEDALLLRQDGITQTLFWADYGSFEVGQQQLRDWIDLVKWAYFPIACSTLLLATFTLKLIMALLFSLLAMSVTSRYKVRFPFRFYLTIAIFSLTPALIIELGVAITGLAIPFPELISLTTTAIYTYMATTKCVEES